MARCHPGVLCRAGLRHRLSPPFTAFHRLSPWYCCRAGRSPEDRPYHVRQCRCLVCSTAVVPKTLSLPCGQQGGLRNALLRTGHLRVFRLSRRSLRAGLFGHHAQHQPAQRSDQGGPGESLSPPAVLQHGLRAANAQHADNDRQIGVLPLPNLTFALPCSTAFPVALFHCPALGLHCPVPQSLVQRSPVPLPCIGPSLPCPTIPSQRMSLPGFLKNNRGINEGR